MATVGLDDVQSGIHQSSLSGSGKQIGPQGLDFINEILVITDINYQHATQWQYDYCKKEFKWLEHDGRYFRLQINRQEKSEWFIHLACLESNSYCLLVSVLC